MTRFIMSIQEAVRLVVDLAIFACGGEVFVTKMKVIRIQDLAEVMIQELSAAFGFSAKEIEIQIIGTKPGEKMFEELMSLEETRRSLELERYFVVLPAFSCAHRRIHYSYDGIVSNNIQIPYNSANEEPLTIEELRTFLNNNRLLERDQIQMEHPKERYWPCGNCVIESRIQE